MSQINFQSESESELERERVGGDPCRVRMGNSSKASSPLNIDRRRGQKKRGRPSLLDLKKRILQKQQEEQESLKRKRGKPNPTPSISTSDLRFSNSVSGRISTRRNPNRNTTDQDEDDDDENTSRKEKKLRLVLDAASNSPDRVRLIDLSYVSVHLSVKFSLDFYSSILHSVVFVELQYDKIIAKLPLLTTCNCNYVIDGRLQLCEVLIGIRA
jgi:hypothetical protein